MRRAGGQPVQVKTLAGGGFPAPPHGGTVHAWGMEREGRRAPQHASRTACHLELMDC